MAIRRKLPENFAYWCLLVLALGVAWWKLSQNFMERDRRQAEVWQNVVDAGAKAESLGVSPEANPYNEAPARALWLEGWMQSREQRGAHAGSW